MADDVILVLGATGGQGGAVVAALTGQGSGARGVRALVRDPDSRRAQALAGQGVEVVAGDMSDRRSLAEAMRGVVAAFALTTPFEEGIDAEVRQGRAIIVAAQDAGLPHLVFSSVAGALQHSGVPHFESKAIVESELVESGLGYTILGPT